MKTIITTGLKAENNFGCPSIMYGTYELLKTLYGDDFVIVNYQKATMPSASVQDISFETIQYSGSMVQRIIALMKFCISKRFPDDEFGRLLKRIKDSDLVVDLYGIYFCYNLNKGESHLYQTALCVLAQFLLPFLAKRLKIKTAKNTASYGPLVTKSNRRLARYTCNHIFDVISAREKESMEALRREAGIKKRILLSPDIANMMPYKKKARKAKPVIGISTSFQIVKQWQASEGYISCIAKLIHHIRTEYQADVLLIPNEFHPDCKYNDLDVTRDILDAVGANVSGVEVLDVENMTGMEIKNEIASCSALVASRYHACVAALSSGVPTLIIGWHYKYSELLAWYEQDEWLLSYKDCTAETLIQTFDRFMGQIDTSRETIQKRYPIVRDAVIEAGREIFACGDK